MYVLLLYCFSITGILTTIFTNIQTGGRDGGSCTAALFLKPFAEGIEAKDGQEPAMKWAHLDIAGSMEVRPFSVLRLRLLLASFSSFLS